MTSSEDFTQRNEKQRKTGVVRWIRRIVLGLLMLLAALAVTGLVYQAVATRNDRQEFPPPGQLVAVDGYQLHINCTGEGSPTVILDASGGNASPSWGLVQPEIAQSTRVCAYDRAGMGWSERGPRPRDMNQHVAELRALLAGAGIEAPRPWADWYRDGAHSGHRSTLWRRRVNPGDESACYRDSSPATPDNFGYGYFRSGLPSSDDG
jgi:hypothetical protein